MAFTEAVEISPAIELADAYVSLGSAVYTNGFSLSDAVELSDANYVAEGSKVFNEGLDAGAAVEMAEEYVSHGAAKVFYESAEIIVYTIEIAPLDDSFLIVVGALVDFTASPTYGKAPLRVSFTNLSGGPITEYYWDFGDGHYSYASEPSHLYERQGLYTVSLRVRMSGSYHTFTRTDYILVYPEGLTMGRTNKAYRFAILDEQGMGPCELSGTDFPMPETRTGVFELVDNEDQTHLLVIDGNDGKIYDMITRDGPASSNMSKVWKDKVGADGTGGTDYDCELTFPEDRGNREHYFIEHGESHLYVRPFDESNRDETGYDSNGYPDGLEIDLSIYEDGNPTAAATTEDIPRNGDLTFDKEAEAHRLNLKSAANMADHLVTGRQQYYVRKDEGDSPANRTMNEDDLQAEFALPSLWPDYCNGVLLNRVTAGALSVSVTQTTGVDSYESAMQFAAAINLGSVSLGGSGELLLWYKGTVAVTIGGTPVALTTHGTSGAWTLAYASGLSNAGDVVITPTGTAEVDDLRIYNSAISTAARTYYYNKIVNGDGGIVRPR